MQTEIAISGTTLNEMSRLATPYFGAADFRPLMDALARLLGARNRKQSVNVVHIPGPEGEHHHRIRALVIVNQEWSRGIIFDKPDPAPGNDDGGELGWWTVDAMANAV